MRHAVIALALLAAACGGPKTTDDPVAQNVIEASSHGTPAAVAAGTCEAKPDFAPVYPDSKLISCTGATGARSGTVLYTSFATPATILAWSKQQATQAGLAIGAEDARSLNAADGNRRTVRIVADPGPEHTTVTVKWSVAS